MRRCILLLLLPLLLTACVPAHSDARVESLFTLPAPSPSEEPPLLDVYVVEADEIIPMDIESYVEGVVAGEMRNDWPLEALKAQAILARTFVLKFVTEKTSRYSGADISTDISEAQAYDAGAVNEHIREAVAATAGEILLTTDGELPYTWFHAHSGGMTELARAGIDWQGTEPAHTRVTAGLDSDKAPDNAKAWSAVFTAAEFIAACRDAGADVTTCREIAVAKEGQSGRAVTLSVDGTSVNAARLRISLGSTLMRSTLLTELDSDGETVRMAGRGYGHGVGMPQWGAYAMAEDGYTGEEIALHYYKDVKLVRAW
ncbi:MAG: SpoIID/LytB domain-containing protein [Clostridia bacterium]|nr:SpoIID/LytB domain-containing protein [Clostridia bacterium]